MCVITLVTITLLRCNALHVMVNWLLPFTDYEMILQYIYSTHCSG